MTKHSISLTLLLTLMQITAFSATLTGLITDKGTNAPVINAEVWVFDSSNNLSAKSTTDSNGSYSITIDSNGTFDVRSTHPDYLPGKAGWLFSISNSKKDYSPDSTIERNISMISQKHPKFTIVSGQNPSIKIHDGATKNITTGTITTIPQYVEPNIRDKKTLKQAATILCKSKHKYGSTGEWVTDSRGIQKQITTPNYTKWTQEKAEKFWFDMIVNHNINKVDYLVFIPRSKSMFINRDSSYEFPSSQDVEELAKLLTKGIEE